MATSLQTVKLPPIVCIDPPNGGTSFHEPMYRFFGLFSVKNADGSLKGTLELGGNFAMFHTCCGGARFSALRVDYRRRDSWYGDSHYVERYSNVGDNATFLRWSWLTANPDALPSVNALAGVDDVHTWSQEKLHAWGEATLAVMLKTALRSHRRVVALGLDRTHGKSYSVLQRMPNVAGLVWPTMLTGVVHSNAQGGRNYTRGGACDYSVGSLREYFRRGFDYLPVHGDTNLFGKLCPYGAGVAHNINSGNTLVNLMVAPEMAPTNRKANNVKLMRAHAKPFEFELYGTLDDTMKGLFDFYNSTLFKRVAPDRPSVA